MVIRTKQHLCALVCIEDKIVLNTLRYEAEIRSAEELKLPPATAKGAGISDKELQMALSLVEGMSEEWKPEQYRDTYKDDVLALVKKKVKAGQTKTITAAEAEDKPAKPSNVVDLVALLQDSLGKRPGKGGTKAAAKPAARKTAAKADTDEEEEEAPAPRRKATTAKKAPAAAARAKSTAKAAPSRKAA